MDQLIVNKKLDTPSNREGARISRNLKKVKEKWKEASKKKSEQLKECGEEVEESEVAIIKEKSLSPFEMMSKGAQEKKVSFVVKEELPLSFKSEEEVADLNFLSTPSVAASLCSHDEENSLSKLSSPKISPKTIQWIEEIASKIVQEVSLVEQEGTSELQITFKEESLFSGAKLVIEDFDSTKKEFNIKLENLNQKAQELVSQQTHQASLRLALEKRGYTLHRMVATTETETKEFAYAAHEGRGSSRQQYRPGDQSPEEEEES